MVSPSTCKGSAWITRLRWEVAAIMIWCLFLSFIRWLDRSLILLSGKVFEWGMFHGVRWTGLSYDGGGHILSASDVGLLSRLWRGAFSLGQWWGHLFRVCFDGLLLSRVGLYGYNWLCVTIDYDWLLLRLYMTTGNYNWLCSALSYDNCATWSAIDWPCHNDRPPGNDNYWL